MQPLRSISLGANDAALIKSNHKESIKTISELDEEDFEEDSQRGTIKAKKKTIDVDVEEYKAGRATMQSNVHQSKEFENKDDLLD